MKESIKKDLIEILKDQQTIFGNDLFDKTSIAVSKKQVSEDSIIRVAERTEVDLEENLFLEDFQKTENLDDLYNSIHSCQKCPLGKTRNKFVYGTGDPNADLMLIGEAPGAEEDKQGEPFVGRAGMLLNDILKAINFSRNEVYIANIIKCRPPNNRDPLPPEMDTCKPYLYKQIDLIKPKIILCLGRVAANVLLNKKVSLTKLRGEVYEMNKIKVMATYHPAALLRNPHWKKGCWEDVQKVRKLYDFLTGNS